MTQLDGALLVSGFALLLVGLTVALRLVERYVPGAGDWLDRHVGEPRAWE